MRHGLAASAALLAAGLLAPAAGAMPGDPPIEVLGPLDGATATVDPDGIPVSFTCSVYRIADPGFPLFGGPKDYGTSMSRSPALGPDGRLADPEALGQGSETPPNGPAQCTGRLGAGGSERPQETPGTWYWQVWRLCTGCPSGYETAPVRRLVIRSEARRSCASRAVPTRAIRSWRSCHCRGWPTARPCGSSAGWAAAGARSLPARRSGSRPSSSCP